MPGEGIIVAVVAGITLAGYGFLILMAKAGGRQVDIMFPPPPEHDLAEALVPEYAAAVRAPDYAGRCRCRACRRRPAEPCSDFDGD